MHQTIFVVCKVCTRVFGIPEFTSGPHTCNDCKGKETK